MRTDIGRFTRAIAAGGEDVAPGAVIRAIAECEEKLRKAEARSLLGNLRELMAGNVAEAREVLEALFSQKGTGPNPPPSGWWHDLQTRTARSPCG